MTYDYIKATAWAVLVTATLAGLIVLGSSNTKHFDAVLIGYAFATLFATFGITRRYALWLQRPPTAMYWRRGWGILLRLLRPRFILRNLSHIARRAVGHYALNGFIWRRGKLRWAAHWLTMWGCLTAAAIAFPLVFGWIHFETPGN